MAPDRRRRSCPKSICYREGPNQHASSHVITYRHIFLFRDLMRSTVTPHFNADSSKQVLCQRSSHCGWDVGRLLLSAFHHLHQSGIDMRLISRSSTLDRRTRALNNFALRSPAPGPGLNAVLWCTPHTQTYLVVTVTSSSIASKVILNLLDDAYTNVMGHISFHGDSVIADAKFFWAGENGVNLNTFNTNNHQQTWRVLGAALFALGDFMFKLGTEAGACYFTIIDGNNEVGKGTVM